eukprot:TRINITY_DN2428_c0_g1_i1.p1 TRINITY_DN2428_c0_g1~~TRINITY_DN2428_c0_g1_i1.p1  ORF type:complete len:336 (-),score=81.74 TRINITY_DN2428_c0_g1_i1:58-1065(-)
MATTPAFFQKTLKGPIEFRIDPLTKQQTRINPARATRPKQGEFDSSFESVIEASAKTCPFCPERILEKVPKFDQKIEPEGRIIQNETVLFPNLNPFGLNHAVGVISNAHFLDIEKFTSSLLIDTITASQKYIKSVTQNNPADKYPVFVWNYLPPSAGSIIHPHIQILVEDSPVPELEKHLNLTQEFYKQTSRNFYSQLVDNEIAAKERYIGGNNSVHAFTSFAPRGFNEVSIVVPGVASFVNMSSNQVADFASALVQLLAGYKSVGVGSFNLVTYSAPAEFDTNSYSLVFKLFSRPFPRGVYTNDTGPMERMYDSFVIDSPPEILAQALRPFWKQ